MVRDPLRLGFALTLTVQSVGCLGFDLVGLEPRDPSGAGTVRIAHGSNASGSAEFLLNPGIDDTGAPRAIASPSLRINDRLVIPSAVIADGALEYATTLTSAEIGGEWLEVQFPDAGGLQATVWVPLVARSGPGELQATSGRTIELPLRFPTGFIDGTGARWTLHLRDRCDEGSTYTQVLGTGLPPSTIVIHPSLRGGAGDQFAACFTIAYQTAGGGDRYRTAIATEVQIEWQITIID